MVRIPANVTVLGKGGDTLCPASRNALGKDDTARNEPISSLGPERMRRVILSERDVPGWRLRPGPDPVSGEFGDPDCVREGAEAQPAAMERQAGLEPDPAGHRSASGN